MERKLPKDIEDVNRLIEELVEELNTYESKYCKKGGGNNGGRK